MCEHKEKTGTGDKMAGITDKDRECIEILSMEISGMLTACNHLLKVTAGLAERLAGITKKIHDISFYNHLQKKNNENQKAGDQ